MFEQQHYHIILIIHVLALQFQLLHPARRLLVGFMRHILEPPNTCSISAVLQSEPLKLLIHSLQKSSNEGFQKNQPHL